MVFPRLEAALADPVARHFEAEGYEAFLEVHFNGRIADVIAVKGDEVVAVELKLRDWRQAHRQAMAYQVGCHRSYVGVPLKTALDALRRDRHAFVASGTGLLAVSTEPRLGGDPQQRGGPEPFVEPVVRELLPARTHEHRFLPFMADALAQLRAR